MAGNQINNLFVLSRKILNELENQRSSLNTRQPKRDACAKMLIYLLEKKLITLQ